MSQRPSRAHARSYPFVQFAKRPVDGSYPQLHTMLGSRLQFDVACINAVSLQGSFEKVSQVFSVA